MKPLIILLQAMLILILCQTALLATTYEDTEPAL